MNDKPMTAKERARSLLMQHTYSQMPKSKGDKICAISRIFEFELIEAIHQAEQVAKRMGYDRCKSDYKRIASYDKDTVAKEAYWRGRQQENEACASLIEHKKSVPGDITGRILKIALGVAAMTIRNRMKEPAEREYNDHRRGD